MTLEFAQTEAKGRASVLGKTHYVIYAGESWAAEAHGRGVRPPTQAAHAQPSFSRPGIEPIGSATMPDGPHLHVPPCLFG